MTKNRESIRMARELARLNSEVAALSRVRQFARSDVPVTVGGETVNVPVTELLQQVPDTWAGLELNRIAVDEAVEAVRLLDEEKLPALRGALDSLETDTLPALEQEVAAAKESAVTAADKAANAETAAGIANGRYTVAGVDPVPADGVGKPPWAVWEVHDSFGISQRRFVWMGSAWVKMAAGPEFFGAKVILAEHLGVGAVTAEKLAAEAITGKTITGGTITGTDIVGATITGTTTVQSGGGIIVEGSATNGGYVVVKDELGNDGVHLSNGYLRLNPRNQHGARNGEHATVWAHESPTDGLTRLQISVNDEAGGSVRARSIIIGGKLGTALNGHTESDLYAQVLEASDVRVTRLESTSTIKANVLESKQTTLSGSTNVTGTLDVQDTSKPMVATSQPFVRIAGNINNNVTGDSLAAFANVEAKQIKATELRLANESRSFYEKDGAVTGLNGFSVLASTGIQRVGDMVFFSLSTYRDAGAIAVEVAQIPTALAPASAVTVQGVASDGGAASAVTVVIGSTGRVRNWTNGSPNKALNLTAFWRAPSA